ncbi:hypothetical protein ACV3RS_15750 [Clostridium perfringens]|uniref:hypothetical protein n=1 Tax=Clostridium TaxID=1485 RepID=UPI002900C76F|nr:hypothetical protein [Clostridium sp.]EGT3601575.1 hypothetical protein [Clostridium perfringens]MDK0980868.1 hypothetical protein [Clostridium perfringens]MDU3019912.1 hypothetical protein [Clostridium perfringens]MDU5108505.1 hypothetical protein [Clostridium sp.]
MLIQNNKKKIRAAYSNEKKFLVTRDSTFRYFIKSEDLLNQDIIELAGEMNKCDEAILKKYPDIKKRAIELTLKEIVTVTRFKKDKSNYIVGGNNIEG